MMKNTDIMCSLIQDNFTCPKFKFRGKHIVSNMHVLPTASVKQIQVQVQAIFKYHTFKNQTFNVHQKSEQYNTNMILGRWRKQIGLKWPSPCIFNLHTYHFSTKQRTK